MRAARLTGEPGERDPVVLVAHGSRDPRAADATRALARAVSAARPGLRVLPSWLDHTRPGPTEVLRELAAAGHSRVVLVPLLLTAAYHRRVDIPEAVAAARTTAPGLVVRVTDVLGPVPTARSGPAGAAAPAPLGVDRALLDGLRRRLAETQHDGYDGLVLAAAGTRDPAARASVGRVAAALGTELGTPTRVSYASAAPPGAGAAVARLRARGARRVAVAAYFLAPGLFHDVVAVSARDAGAVAVAAPLSDAPELADLVLGRVDAVRERRLPDASDGGRAPRRNRPRAAERPGG